MKFRILVLVLIMLLTGLFFASFLVGTYPIPVGTVWDVLWSGITEFTPYWDPAVEKVIFQDPQNTAWNPGGRRSGCFRSILSDLV